MLSHTCPSHFLTQHVKKMSAQMLRFNKINNFYLFIKDTLCETSDFFLNCKCVGVKNITDNGTALIYAQALAVLPTITFVLSMQMPKTWEKANSTLILLRRHAQSLSRIWLFETPWTMAPQASLSMEFPRQEYWSRLPFPSPGDLLGKKGLNSSLLSLLHWQAHSLTLCHLE